MASFKALTIALGLLTLVGACSADPRTAPTPSSPAIPEITAHAAPVPGRQLGPAMYGHSNGIVSPAVGSVNGKPVIVTGGSDDLLRVWDPATRKLIGEPIPAGQGGVYHVELHHWDGKDIAVVSGGTLRAWDLGTRRPLTPPIMPQTLDTNLLAVGSHDGQHVALTEGEYDELQLWNLTTGSAVGAPLKGHEAEPRAGAIGQLGGTTIAVTGDADKVLRSWDLKTGKALATAKVTSIDYISSIAIQGGVAVVTGTDGDFYGRMERWDLATGAVTEVKHKGEFFPVELSELDGRTVTILGGDSTLRVADLATGKVIGQGWDSDDLLDYVAAVGKYGTTPILVIGDPDGTLTIWDLRTGSQLGKPFFGYGGGVETLAVTKVRGKAMAVTAGRDNTIRMWDLATHKPFRAPVSCSCIEYAPMTTATRDGKPVIVYADIEHGLVARDAATGKRVDKTGIFVASDNGPAPLSADGSVVASATRDGEAELWDLSTGNLLRQVTATGVDAVAVGSRVIATASGRQIKLWDQATGQPIGKPITSGGQAKSLAIGQVDGKTIVFFLRRYAPEWGSIRLWDATTGEPYGKALSIRSTAMAVTRVGSRTVLVTGQDDGTVIVWDPQTMKPLLPPFSGHDGAVSGVAVTMLKGKPIAVSGGNDGSIRIWDLTDLSH
ncbi:WD40 repeat protein [Streptosporangium album]|uniref:WD40 repeat protein n=1 Tax=Streptosporangium album TaxID=47479 RepID=A0A7W7S290_9ACTN|nr:WD40 repeat domain-containing protein [Streptosporangium album]MBB4942594.1 WD40 repeat protein [Streptosporangium album]